MQPCLPNPIPFECGCVVRDTGIRRVDAQSLQPLYALTYWHNHRAYQATLICEVVPALLDVMTHFDRFPDKWTAVSAPISKSL
jgi:hypothetical protein